MPIEKVWRTGFLNITKQMTKLTLNSSQSIKAKEMVITRVYIKDVFMRMFPLFGLETRT